MKYKEFTKRLEKLGYYVQSNEDVYDGTKLRIRTLNSDGTCSDILVFGESLQAAMDKAILKIENKGN